MGFKILFSFIIIVYAITITYNSSSNKDFAAPQISWKKPVSTRKEFYESVRRKRHCTREELYKNTTAIVLIRLLLLSGDVELNRGPWTCVRCSQIFRHQDKFDNHLINQQLVSCIYCLKDFCSTYRCHRHQRTCPLCPTATTTPTTTVPQPTASSTATAWICNHCSLNFDRRDRYDNHLRNQQLISCRHCHRRFCTVDRCQQHERSEHPAATSTSTTTTTTGDGIRNLDVPILGDTKYQKQKGYIKEARANDKHIHDKTKNRKN